MSLNALQVLVVEDDPGDVLLIEEAFAQRGAGSILSVVGDGEEALAFLRRQPPYAEAPTPDLVLLDLNLPRVDGRQVLAAVKADDALRHIPIVVLTTSGAPEDIVGSYQLRANAFVTKPTDFDDFSDVVASIEQFYADIARLPRLEQAQQ